MYNKKHPETSFNLSTNSSNWYYEVYYVQRKNSGHTASKQKLFVLELQDDVKKFSS